MKKVPWTLPYLPHVSSHSQPRKHLWEPRKTSHECTFHLTPSSLSLHFWCVASQALGDTVCPMLRPYLVCAGVEAALGTALGWLYRPAVRRGEACGTCSDQLGPLHKDSFSFPTVVFCWPITLSWELHRAVVNTFWSAWSCLKTEQWSLHFFLKHFSLVQLPFPKQPNMSLSV